MFNKYLLSFLILFFNLSPLFSKTVNKYTISGFINEKNSKENLPGASIYIANIKSGTTTNNYGFYSITLPQDTVTIIFSYIGYKPQVYKFYLNKNTPLDILLESNAELKEIEVSAEKQEKISDEVQMSKIDIPVEQIKDIPALLGEKDVLKVIQLLPGVQKGSEGSSGIYVRGGGPDQNLIILDDATVYNVSHLFGFFSLFNGDALKSVELTKGGFPARYGGRLSSVLEMQMKDGDKQKFKGEAGIGLISSRFTLEGPIKKDKASFLISARRTYIDALVAPILNKYEGVFAGYFFYDVNAKINYTLNRKNRLYLSGYFGKDKFYLNIKDEEIKTSLKWGNATGTVRWNCILNDKTFSNLSFVFTDFLFDISAKEEEFNLKYSSGIRDYALKWDLNYSPGPRHFFRGGTLLTFHSFRPSAVVIKDEDAELNYEKKQFINAYETGLYIEDDYKINERLKANAGIRLSSFYVKNENYINLEPRLSLRYKIKPTFSIKASYATMNQYLHLLSNSGIGLPTDLWVPATDKVKPQQSQQIALGLAKDLEIKNAQYMLSLEGYYKKSKNVIQYKDGASFIGISIDEDGADGEADEIKSISYEDMVTSGSAESYGAELFFQKKSGKFTGWLGYTLSWTWLQFDELNFGKRFPARYDRRHDISLVGIYKFNDRISLSATWVYGTGNAISLPLESYQVNSQVNTGAMYSNSFYIEDFGERNSFRMGAYHRFDIAVQFHKKKKRFERIFEFGLYNAYNRKNPFYYYVYADSVSQEYKLMQVSLFPIIPSVSWTWKF